MKRISIECATEADWLALRARDITSTGVAALFGLSPYKTAFELWHELKSGKPVAVKVNDRMKWGNRLEATVAYGIAEDREWTVRPFKEYGCLPDLRIGSSFDFRVRADRSGEDSPDDAILEIKTVDPLRFRDGWTVEDDFIEAPAHIELQVQHQMLVSGLRRAYIGVMIGGNRIEVLEREADDAVHSAILAKCADFWQSIASDKPPSPVMPDDAAAIIRLNQFAEPGKLLDARQDERIAGIVARFHELGRQAANIAEEREVAKAELLAAIGDAEKVMLDGYTVSAGIVGPATVSYTREGYRNLRVTQKKAKAPANDN